MKKMTLGGIFVLFAMILAACSSNPLTMKQNTHGNVPDGQEMRESTASVGGNLAKSMDSIDKDKLSHALDKPFGKETTWTNAMSGITYSVIPVKKETVNGNSFCRTYQVTATKGENKKEYSGTACVSDSGTWEGI